MRLSSGRAAVATLLVIATGAGVGCGAPDPATRATEVRDSAGIEIVENRGTDGLIAKSWVVTDTPSVRLGSALDPPAPEQFSIVPGAVRLSDGTIVVAERRAGEVRFFDASGRHLVTRGGRGEGPREFDLLASVTRDVADSVLVHDDGTWGYSLFNPSGDFVRTVRPDIAELRARFEGTGRICTSSMVFPDGTILFCGAAPELPTVSGMNRARTTRFVRLHLDTARVDHLGLYLGIENYVLFLGPNHTTSTRHPFFSNSHVALGHDPLRLYLANNPAYEIEVWHPDGRLVRIMRRADADLRPTDGQREEAMEVFLEDEGGAFVLDRGGDVPIPDSIPAVEGLTAGPAGELWVERGPRLPSRTRTRFDVFGGDGRYLGDVIVGREVDLLDVGQDFLLTLRTNELDVPIIELYELRRSPS